MHRGGGLKQQSHMCLLWCSVVLFSIAGLTAGYCVLPSISTALRSGDNVVNRLALALCAVCALILVSFENTGLGPRLGSVSNINLNVLHHANDQRPRVPPVLVTDSPERV